ncbi:hypothetical protein K435DRAFT_848040 [Dendrothele bispora CBS 962.96]|uniref:Uncharacterized protein n=1 Tax=Dendrothele bispora (strain CBS 962.96) TaxID=1314807 RepID=A0A4S8MYM4_DENBC|nr:hypothetical protein K435DRAFT_848040 [Dendrothele bispora CBS 962.96]
MSHIATPTLICKRSVHFPEILAKSAPDRPRKIGVVYPRVAQNRAIPSDRKSSYDLYWRFERLSVAGSLPDNFDQFNDECQVEGSAIAKTPKITDTSGMIDVAQSPEAPSTPFASPRVPSSFTSPSLGPIPLSQLLTNVNKKAVYCSPTLASSSKFPSPAVPGSSGLSTDSLTDDSYISDSSSMGSSSGSESD